MEVQELKVIAASSFSGRIHKYSLTASSVCQGGFPVEDSQISLLQAFEYKELNGGRDWD